ncbi:uncharacterized protein [Haliotis cracherodii]|uniref:uncharacterized protein n=1 Tax=Haliotis cracherodii TaxID=6455 RepID=UPI0039E8E16D
MIPQCRKARVKVSMKKHLNQSRLKGTKVDSLLWLDYMMFLRRLATQAHLAAVDQKEKTVALTHVKMVSKKVLQSCRG